MKNEIIKLEERIKELQKYAKENKSEIIDMNKFAEDMYMIMLKTIISVISSRMYKYETHIDTPLVYPNINFLIVLPNCNCCRIDNLVAFLPEDNYTDNSPNFINNLSDNFLKEYEDIISNNSVAKKFTKFFISKDNIELFFNCLEVLMENNESLNITILDLEHENSTHRMYTFSLKID